MEVAIFDRQTDGRKGPIRHRDLLSLSGYDLKNAGLQNHVRIRLVDLRSLELRSLQITKQIRFASPQAKTSPDELRSNAFQRPNVVIQIAAAVEQALHGNRA